MCQSCIERQQREEDQRRMSMGLPPLYSPSPWSNAALRFDMSDFFKSSPSTPKPATPAEKLASEARKLASEGNDLSGVTRAIEAEKRDQQRAVEKSLEATLELQKLSNAGKTRESREFTLVYLVDGETKTVRGIEWPDEREDKTKEDYVTRVALRTGIVNLPTHQHSSMTKLKEALAKAEITYRLAYID